VEWRKVLVAATTLAVLGGLLLTSQPFPPSDQDGFVRACGYTLPEVHRDFAKGMRKDCGIYDPQATRTSGD
jgi:hypothetical protein